MLNEYPSSVIFGCSCLALTPEEQRFFERVNPLGFILFSRNIATADQLKTLVQSLRDVVEREDVPIFIDQEGGRVQRLRPPLCRKYSPAQKFGEMYEKSALTAVGAVYDHARSIGRGLKGFGIDVDCLPVLDVPTEGSNEVVLGDRTFSKNPHTVGALGHAVCQGLLAEGVIPVVKHMPGHGRAVADSHYSLPVVDTDFATLAKTDFVPFKYMADAPMGMTAHILYSAIDSLNPASLSEKVIQDVIRDEIGFKGFLISDDLSMKALSGEMTDIASEAVFAGCDAVLHCNGNMDEMELVASGVGQLSARAMERFKRAQEIQQKSMENAPAYDDIVMQDMCFYE